MKQKGYSLRVSVCAIDKMWKYFRLIFIIVLRRQSQNYMLRDYSKMIQRCYTSGGTQTVLVELNV
jgi:hypothetical protein